MISITRSNSRPGRAACLNVLIELMSMISVVFAGLVGKFAPKIGPLTGLN